MKKLGIIFAVYLALGALCVAQTKPTTPPPPSATAAPTGTPVLSVAYRVALQALEEKRHDAQKQYMDAYQTEQAVLRDFAADHPGWHLNAQNFGVEKDPAPAARPTPPPNKK